MSEYNLTIGALSKETDCAIETIRYYERIGLLPNPPRSAAGHRRYGRSHVKLLAFVRQGRALGFSLRHMQLIVERGGGNASCDEIRDIATKRLTQVREEIAELRRVESVLVNMGADCARRKTATCPVVEASFGSATS